MMLKAHRFIYEKARKQRKIIDHTNIVQGTSTPVQNKKRNLVKIEMSKYNRISTRK
jgi:hypothetical protein